MCHARLEKQLKDQFLRKRVSTKLVPSWSHASWVTNDKTFLKNFLAIRLKAATRRKKRKKTRLAIVKLFALQPNEKYKNKMKNKIKVSKKGQEK